MWLSKKLYYNNDGGIAGGAGEKGARVSDPLLDQPKTQTKLLQAPGAVLATSDQTRGSNQVSSGAWRRLLGHVESKQRGLPLQQNLIKRALILLKQKNRVGLNQGKLTFSFLSSMQDPADEGSGKRP